MTCSLSPCDLAGHAHAGIDPQFERDMRASVAVDQFVVAFKAAEVPVEVLAAE